MSRTKKDLNEAKKLNINEARYLVDLYYQLQDLRKATSNQCLSMQNEPHETFTYFSNEFQNLENEIKKTLDKYTSTQKVGVWCKSIMGIGPVISAGLLANIDITKAPTAGNLWSFAGLNPGMVWEKGQKRPYNARLKVLCWKIGQSFVKVSGKESSLYGKIYRERKTYELEQNELGAYKEQAEAKLKKFKIGKTTEAYKYYSSGKLPPAHIQQRAERYATKIFLSHLHTVMYYCNYGVMPPEPYPIAILGHAHKIEVPNFNLITDVGE